MASTERHLIETQSDGWQVLHTDPDLGEKLCPDCKGAGRWDSCFECGNRGTFTAEQRSIPRRSP
jgi:hypothetical protein